MRRDKRNYRQPRSFQRRTMAKSLNYLKISDQQLTALFFIHALRFYYIYFRLLRRRLRLLFKRKQGRGKNRRFWINMQVNFPLTKKSKNSRMGHGAGAFVRWVCHTKPYWTFIATQGASWYLSQLLVKKLKHWFWSKLAINQRGVKSASWSCLSLPRRYSTAYLI